MAFCQTGSAYENSYYAWHVHCISAPTPNEKTYADEDTNHNIHTDMEMNEWKVLLRLVPTGIIHINEIDMLGF